MAFDVVAPPRAGEYAVGLFDPAWTFETYSEKGELKSPQAHYDTMTLEEIAALPVGAWMASDAVLFVWATFPMMEQFFSPRIVWNEDGSVTIHPRFYEAWGFKYSGLAWCWRKFNSDTGKYSFGGGYGSRKNLEPCFIFRRGKCERHDKSIRDFIEDHASSFMDEKRRLHSQKPDEQYRRIEAMFDGPYLEGFATQSFEGWDHWAPHAHRFKNVPKNT